MTTIYCLIIGLLLILFAGGCGDRGADRVAREALERADAVLDEMPDSALAIIKGIDTTRLNTERLKADYSLLRTMALLKTDPSSATVEGLKPAYEYYGDSGEPSRQAMLTHFAKGMLADSIESAFDGFNKSIRFAYGEYAIRYEGMASLNKSRYYHGTMSHANERMLINKGLKCLSAANDKSALAYGYLLSGNAYIGCHESDSAVYELQKAIAISGEAEDDDIKMRSALSLAYAKSLKGCDEEAVEGFTQVMSEGKLPFSTYDINAFVRSLAKTGRIEEAESYMDFIPDGGTPSQKSDRFCTLSVLMTARGYDRMAYAFKDSMTAYANNAVIEKSNGDDIGSVSPDYENVMSDGKENATFWAYLSALLIFVALVAALLFEFNRRRGNRSAVESNTVDAVDSEQYEDIAVFNKIVEEFRKVNTILLARVADLEKDYRRRTIEYEEYSDRLSEMRGFMKTKVLICHSRIAGFCNRYSSPKAREKAGRDILERRKEFLDDYRGEKNLGNIIRLFDLATANGFSGFLRKCGMTANEEKVTVYSACGFDYNVISELTGLSSSNVATIRSRLKKRLKEKGIDAEIASWMAVVEPAVLPGHVES